MLILLLLVLVFGYLLWIIVIGAIDYCYDWLFIYNP